LLAVIDAGTYGPLTMCMQCRNSMDYAGWKDRKRVAQALRPI
jgi:hypothetical protein